MRLKSNESLEYLYRLSNYSICPISRNEVNSCIDAGTVPAFLFEYKKINMGASMHFEKSDVIETIKSLLHPILEENGLELVDVEYAGGGRGSVLRIFIDKENGITVEDCADISREFGFILDVRDVIPYSYTLEVSSPGLNRALKDSKDFMRFKGKKVKIKTKEDLYQRRVFIGHLIDFHDDVASIQVEGEIYDIPFRDIEKANLELEL
jgi:ribosome maturation factor RimP